MVPDKIIKSENQIELELIQILITSQNYRLSYANKNFVEYRRGSRNDKSLWKTNQLTQFNYIDLSEE